MAEKVTITKKELVEFSNALTRVGSLKGSVKWAAAVDRNVRYIKDEVENLTEAGKPVEGALEFEKARNELCILHAEKGEDGKPKTNEDGTTYNIANPAAFATDMEELKAKHADVIKQQEAKNKEVEELLKETVEIEVRKISLSIIPDDISPAQISGLFPMLNDEE